MGEVTMVKLSELKKKWEEQKKEEELDQYETVTLTIIDCAEGVNLSCFSVEKRVAIVIPNGLEGYEEIKKKISEGKMLRVTIKKRKWSERAESIERIEEIPEEEIEVDGEFTVSPSMYGGVVLRGNEGVYVVRGGTINYQRLMELLDKGIDVVAAKLSNVVSTSRTGLKKVYGIWIYAPQIEEEEKEEKKEESQELPDRIEV